MISAGVSLSSMLLAAVAVVLFRRVDGACKQSRRTLVEGVSASPYPEALAQCVQRVLDDSLLLSSGAGGLQDRELRFREHQDSYRTVAELLADINCKVRAGGTIPF